MDLLRNPLVAGLLGAVAFLGLLFAVAALLQLLRSWLAPLARLSSLEPSDDELISALRETAQRLRTRRFLRPAVEDCCIPRQKPLPPASEASVLAEEASLGRPLPTLLRRIYREVASGEFGPAYGLLGVGGGATDELDNHIGSAYKLWHGSARAEENLPPGHLPLFSLGGNGQLCVDLDSPALEVFAAWPALDEAEEPEDDAPSPMLSKPFSPSLRRLLAQWVQGEGVVRGEMPELSLQRTSPGKGP